MISEPIEPNAEVPPPVRQHVGALDVYVSELSRKGELSPESTAFGHLFAKRHDAGYGTDIDIMRTGFATDILGRVFDAIGSSVSPRYVAEYLQRNKDDYVVARIMGHGVLGVVENTRYFEQERHLSRRRALGLASILSAHHSGFPITMVGDFLQENVAIPVGARSAFFIDDAGENPEVVRHRLAKFGANELGIGFDDALRAAVLGYSLDRLSAGSTPSELLFHPGGGVELRGGEVIQKKYGLVAGDLNRRGRDEPLVIELFHTVLHRIKAETEAAVAAADAANAPDIRRFVKGQEASIHASTHKAQQDAMIAMYNLGLTGRFSDLHKEREKLSLYAQCVDDPNILYALATYDAIIASISKRNS